MSTILDKILEKKKLEIAERKSEESEETLREKVSSLANCRGFVSNIRKNRKLDTQPAVIAEIKRGSPSKGIIREDLQPVETALAFAKNGASCLSVLTDESFFLGNLNFLSEIGAALEQSGSSIPLLRKEFIIDPYQVVESRAYGADAILLIVSALSQEQLSQLHSLAIKLGLDVLIEVHDDTELERFIELRNSLNSDARARTLLGVNNRDLKTFEVSLETTEELSKKFRAYKSHQEQDLLVSESGIHSGANINRLRKAGADAYLIGESLVAKGNPGENISELFKQYSQLAD